MIRKLDKTEYDRATSLALEVYIQCGAEDFDEEGLNSFKSFIFSEQLMNELVIYGAFDNENLVGIMGTKNEGKHLSLFFIGKEHHRKGIAIEVITLFIFSVAVCTSAVPIPLPPVSAAKTIFALIANKVIVVPIADNLLKIFFLLKLIFSSSPIQIDRAFFIEHTLNHTFKSYIQNRN